jgi:hypothetical protein
MLFITDSILFNLYCECLNKEDLEQCGDFRRDGRKIRVVKYADGLVLHRNQRMVLQGIIDRLIEIARWYRMEVNVQKNQGNENLKRTIPATNLDR